MTDVSSSPGKIALRRRLVQLGERALIKEGWTVERAGLGKSSMRKITRGAEKRFATIRTSQDTWIAFPRNSKNDGWSTLEDSDLVVAASVDTFENPKSMQAHIIDAAEMRDRFDRAFKARIDAGHKVNLTRGVWISLYEPESKNPVNLVGAGAGLTHKPVLIEPIKPDESSIDDTSLEPGGRNVHGSGGMSIAQAKAALSISLGVPQDAIRIIVEG